MAEKIKENQFDKVGVNPFNAPVPGESLTTPTDMPKAWERPPEYTTDDEALKALYMEVTQIDTLRKLINMMNQGIPLDEIAQVILYKGYTVGKYTPDLMLLLIEPTLYLLIAIADYADIDDYVLYDGEDNDPDTEIPDDDVKPIIIDNENKEVKEDKPKMPSPENIEPSLLSRVKEDLPSKVREAKESN